MVFQCVFHWLIEKIVKGFSVPSNHLLLFFRGQVDLVFLDLPEVFPVLGAVGQEIHLWSPLQVKEELLEGAGHLDAVVVLEGFVQLLDYILETIILRSGRVDHVFDLAPGRTAEAGQKVDGGLLPFCC